MGKGAVYAFLGPFATNDKMAQKREGVDKMLSHFSHPHLVSILLTIKLDEAGDGHAVVLEQTLGGDIEMTFFQGFFDDLHHGSSHIVGLVKWRFFDVKGNFVTEHLNGVELPSGIFLFGLELTLNGGFHILILL